jgi:hypothetical protein
MKNNQNISFPYKVVIIKIQLLKLEISMHCLREAKEEFETYSYII